MAPVDPTDLLKAFKPLLTVNGGIKSVGDVPRLSLLMKRYSKKLVSRCVYCNILLATTPDVLLCFLERDGWDLINSWLKESLNGCNYPFICELLDLLNKCPMNIDRLKLNDTPKLVKSLSKNPDEKEVAEKAKLVVDKWTELIRLDRINENVNNGNTTTKKKRKKEKSVDDDEADAAKIRKVKGSGGGILQQQTSVNSSGDVTTTTTTITKSTAASKTTDDETNANRPRTAKVSYGKSRSLGILEDANSTSGKSKSSKKGDDDADKSGPGNKTNKLNNKSADNSVAVSNSGPNSNSNATPKLPSKPILKEADGFFESIVNTSSTGQVRKRRKSDSKSKSSATSGSNAAKDPVPDSSCQNEDSGTGPEPMDTNDDLSDEVEEERITSAGDESNSNINDIDKLPIVDVPEVDNLVIPEIEPIKLPGTKKSILSYGKKIGRGKKSVRWRSDDRIKEIKYFELDETERTNVSKTNFGDFRANDIRKEREMMNQLRSNRGNSGAPVASLTPATEKCITYLPWKLILIDLPPGLPLIEVGYNSEERRIQTQAANNLLNADFFPVKEGAHEHFPKEPDLMDAGVHANPLEIPLDDENLTVTDYSSMPYPPARTQELYPSNRGPPVPPMPVHFQNPGMGPRPPVPMNRAPFPPTGFVPPVGYPYGPGPPGVPGPYPGVPGIMPPRPMPGRGPGFQTPRMDGGWPPRPRGPPICRYFLKTGSCRFMARCNYLHQYPPTNPHGPGSSTSSSQSHME